LPAIIDLKFYEIGEAYGGKPRGVGTVANRAEIAGVISRTEQQLDQFRADLVLLDATLRLFCTGAGTEGYSRKENPATRSLV